MLKKVMLSIVAMALLAGAENLPAKERVDRPGAEQKCRPRQMHQQMAGIEAVRKCPEGLQQRRKGMHRRQNRPAQQAFDQRFNALIKAYRENDREKMGRILGKMNQVRQSRHKGRDVFGGHQRDLLGRHRAGQWPGRFRGRSGRPGEGFKGRGMNRRGQGFRGRGIGKWQCGIGGGPASRCGGGFGGRNRGRPGRGFGW